MNKDQINSAIIKLAKKVKRVAIAAMKGIK